MPSLRQRIEQLEQFHLSHSDRNESSVDLSKYRADPVGYARDILKIEPTPDQIQVAQAILQPPYRVMVKSGHNIGKTFLAAWMLNWWYDTRPSSVVISTAPTKDSVERLLWTEVRLQRSRAKLPETYIGPAAPEMRTSPDHYAKGMTSSSGEGFQGSHRADQFFIFDEAEGVESTYWRVTGTMFQADGTNAWLAILNPTTTTSQSFIEERALELDGERKWKVFSLSSLNHPNILAQIRGEPPPIPTAVTLSQVKSWLADWFEPVAAEDAKPETDIEFPVGSGNWYRPGPEGESRVLGRRPTAGTYSVWSEALWAACSRPSSVPLGQLWEEHLPEIGCDVARFGDDKTEIHGRIGPKSIHHEERSGWDTVRVAGKLMELADEFADRCNRNRPPQAQPITGKELRIKVDDTGVGGGVTDILRSNGYNAVPVNAGSASEDARYPLVRDHLWFSTREKALANGVDLSALAAKTLARLEVQALSPTWQMTVDKRRKVERKEDTKKRLHFSPDGLDAINLAYYDGGSASVAEWVDTGEESKDWRNRRSR